MTTREGLESRPSTPDGSDKQHPSTSSSELKKADDVIRDTGKAKQQGLSDNQPRTSRQLEKQPRPDSPNPMDRRRSFDLGSSLASHSRDLAQRYERSSRSTSPHDLSPRPEEQPDHTAIEMDRLLRQEHRKTTTESYDNLRAMEEGGMGESSDNITPSRYEQLTNEFTRQMQEHKNLMSEQFSQLSNQMSEQFSQLRQHYEQNNNRGSDHSSTSSNDSQTPWYRSWDWHNTRGNTYASYFGGYVGGGATLAGLGITIYEGWSLMHPSHA